MGRRLDGRKGKIRMREGQAISIATQAGPLAAAVHLPQRFPSPVVVCCHGMLSNKASSKYVDIADVFNRAGIAVVRFDFSGCGESQASPLPDLITSRVRDLHAVLVHVQDASWASGPVGLLGSSMGGYIACLVASSGRHDLGGMVCWATPFDLTKITGAREVMENHRRILPGGVGIGLPLNLDAMNPVPGMLVLHGRQDEIVPWKDCLDLYRHAGEPKRVFIMETADHRFADPAWREMAIRMSLEWFQDRGFVESRPTSTF